MRKLSGLLAVLVLAALVLSACGGTPAPSSGGTGGGALAGDATRGQAKFQGTCAGCHGPDAKGLPGLGKNLTTSTFAKGLSDADLVAFVKKGRPASDPANTTGVDMPPRGGNPALSDQDLFDIVAYVRTLQQ